MAVRAPAPERDFNDEASLHLDLRAAELEEQGVPPQQARELALASFGDPARWRRSVAAIDRSGARHHNRREWLGALIRDLRIGLRSLRRTPLVAFGAVASFALGIGATTTMFSIGHAIMAPLPFPEADRLTFVSGIDRAKGFQRVGDLGLRLSELVTLREQSRTITAGGFEDSPGHLGDGEAPAERVAGDKVTAGFFSILGVRPLLGREILEADEGAGAPAVVVLGYRVWTNRFQADSAILGRTVRLNGVATQVVGVMPPDFAFPSSTSAVWTPLRLDPATVSTDTTPHVRVIGRLRGRAAFDQAAGEVDRLGLAAVRQRAGDPNREGLRLFPAEDWSIQPQGRIRLYAMTAIISFVLLIACSNVANLLLARAASRAREMAVRTCLGAPRSAIIRASLVEALTLAVAGGGIGTILAAFGVTIFGRSVAAEVPPWQHFGVDGEILAFVFGLVILSALITGVGPGRRAASVAPAIGLHEAQRGSSGLRLGRLSRELAVLQVTLATTLLLLAGLVIRGARDSVSGDPIPSPKQVASARVELRRDAYPTPARQAAFLDQVTERLRALPGVTAVAAGTALPGFGGPTLEFTIGPAPSRPSRLPVAGVSAVTTGFFAALGIPILSGREFQGTDRVGTQRVAVISQSLADRFFAGGPPLGATILVGDPADVSNPAPRAPAPAVIIGVAANVATVDGNASDRDVIYLPFSQVGDERIALAVRVTGRASDILPAVGKAVFAVDHDVPVFQERILSDGYEQAGASAIVFTGLFSAFGLAGLSLAGVGVFALVAFGVRQRARETGIRLALGEPRGSILWRIVQGMGLRIVLGMVIGVALAAALGPALGDALLGADPHDPLVFAVVTAVIGGVTAAALLLPAARALHVDPAIVLRSD